MGILELLTIGLASPLAKFLLKQYLGDPATEVGGGLLDIAKRKIKEYSDQREAQRQFESLADRVVKQLLPLFEHAERTGQINIEAVIHELANTLEGRVSADFFLNKDLDSTQLTREFRMVRPLPQAMFSEAETAFYDRALEQVIRYIVEIGAQLPRFQAAFAAESLQRLSHMSRDLDSVLETVQRIESLVSVGDSSDELQRYEKNYRLAVIRNLDYVELFGADIASESRRHSLLVAYVSLNLGGETAKEAMESLPAERVLDSLGLGGRLLIRGDAGSGKSTLFRWAALQAADQRRPDFKHPLLFSYYRRFFDRLRRGRQTAFRAHGKALEAATKSLASEIWQVLREDGDEPNLADIRKRTGSLSAYWHFTSTEFLEKINPESLRTMAWLLPELNWRTRIPFLIRLRDCPGGQLPTPENFPLVVAKELGNPPPTWVTSILTSGQGLILLDGIDELPNLHRDRLQREIEALVGAYPDNQFLVSTRPAAVPENWLAKLKFREARINPMSEVDRSLFIDNWHKAVARELEGQGKPSADLGEMASELKEKLANDPPMARLASNPLLCAMMCALHRDRSQKLPESQMEMCEALCQMLLHRREREVGLDLTEFPEPYRTLSYEEKRAIVQDLAHYMVRNGESTVAFEQGAAIVANVLKYFPGRSSNAEIVLRGLVERSGILREMRPGYTDFIHNTIKEYLAADRFVEEHDVGFLATHALEPAWQPIVLFAVATRQRGFATEVIQRILNDVENQNGRARKLLALRCRTVALHLDPNINAQLGAIERELFPPRTMADAEALAAAGDSVVPLLGYRKRSNARQIAACIRTLRLIGSNRAREYLNGYLKDHRQIVVSELAHALNPLEIDLVQQYLIERRVIPEGIASQIRDLTPLAALTGLQALFLNGTQVTDLTPLAALTGLRVFDAK